MFDDLKNKATSFLGTLVKNIQTPPPQKQSGSFFDTLNRNVNIRTNPKNPVLHGTLLPGALDQIRKSNQAFTDMLKNRAPFGSPEAIKDTVSNLFTMRDEPVEVRRPFEKTPIKTNLPPVITGAAKFGNYLVELVPKVTAQAVANFSPSQETTLSFDKRRLGFQGEGNTIESTGRRMVDYFDRRMEDSPDTVKTNILISSLIPVSDAFDAFVAGDILTSAARQGLNITKYDKVLNDSLARVGLDSSKANAQTLKEQFMNRAQSLIRNNDIKGLNELGQSTNYIAQKMTGEGIPNLNKLGEFIQNLSKNLLKDVGSKESLIRPLGYRAQEGLPGYRERPGQAPAMGMSTKEVEGVGFGKNEKLSGAAREKYGKDFMDLSKSEMKDIASKNNGEVILSKDADMAAKKFATAKFSKDTLEMKPELLFGGLKNGVFTDSFSLISNKEAANEILGKELEKKKLADTKKLVEQGTSHTEATTIVNNIYRQKAVDMGDGFPDWKQIMPKGESTPVEFQGTNFDKVSGPQMVFQSGDKIVAVNADYYANMRKALPDHEIGLSDNGLMLTFSDGKKIEGLLMSINSDVAELKAKFGDTGPLRDIQIDKQELKAPTQTQTPKAITAKEAVEQGLTVEEFVKKESFNPNSTIEYHISDNPNLVSGKSFAEQKTPTNIGERGFGGKEENIGQIFSTKNPQSWSAQLNYEGNKKPQYVYLVEVKNPGKVDIMDGLPQQSINSPQDVKILSRAGGNKELLNPSALEAKKISQLRTEYAEELAKVKAPIEKVETPAGPVTVYRNPENLSVVEKIETPAGAEIYNKSEPSTELVMGDPKPANDAKLKEYNDKRSKTSELWTKIVEKIQSNKKRIKNLMKDPNAKVTEANDPVLAMTLYHGRLETKMQDLKSVIEKTTEKMVRFSKGLNIKYDDFKEEINDYLHALHTPERNARLGDGAAGLTDAQAEEAMKKLTASPHYKEIKEVADDLLKLNHKTLDILYADGNSWAVITKDTLNTLRDTYKNHVPLNRIFGEENNVGEILASKGFDVRSSGIRSAKGSSREVSDITGNITANVASAVQRIEKNIVDTATLNFVKENKDLEFATILKEKPAYAGENILTLMQNGKPVFIKFEDMGLAKAFKGTGNDKMPEMLRFITAFTRLYAGIHTRFNAEFFISNKFRDVQEAMVYAGSQKELGVGSILAKEIRLKNEKAILDYLRGKDTPGARLYREMLEEGGTTGGMALSTKEQVIDTIADIEKIAKSKPRQAMQMILRKIDQLNELFENSTRLSVYENAIANGASKRRAAQLAKESTVNFNEKGTWGTVLNSLWMFANASIQGSAKMLKAMRNPKVLAAVLATVGTAVYTTNKFNDEMDPEWREKVNKWDRDSNLTIVLSRPGEDFKYITMPVSYAIKPIKIAFDGGFDLIRKGSTVTAEDVLTKTAASILNGYNPIGGTDLLSAALPTILDVPVEITRNKKWSGNQIKPDYDKDLPDSRQYFDSVKDTKPGRVAIGITKYLSEKHIAEISPADMLYAYEQYIGGAGKFVSKTVDTVTKVSTGEKVDIKGVPIVSRFFKSVSGDELQSRLLSGKGDTKIIKEIKSETATKRFDTSQDAKGVIEDMSGKTFAEKKAMLLEIAKQDPNFAQSVLDEVAKSKDEVLDKQIKSLDIKNGQRAKYIRIKLDAMTSLDEKKAFLVELAQKELLTVEILNQVTALKNNPTQ